MIKIKQKISNFIFSPEVITKLLKPFLYFKKRKKGEIKKILIVRLDDIGDLVLTTPLIRELKRAHPEAKIDLIIKTEIANLFEICPYLENVIPFKWSGYLNMLKFVKNNLWGKKYDLAIMPRWDTDLKKASLMAYLSNSPRRIGYSEKNNNDKAVKNKNYDLFFTETILDKTLKHEVERNLKILKYLKIKPRSSNLELWTNKNDEMAVGSILEENQLTNKKIAALGIGAAQNKRIWALKNYELIAKWLGENLGFKIIIIGGGEDFEAGEMLKSGNKEIINLAGKTSLRETFAILKKSSLYVGNDSGPMHISAATGIPTIEISCHPLKGLKEHANSPERFRPWMKKYSIVQPTEILHPCYNSCIMNKAHCINLITIKQAQEKILEVIKENNL